MKRRLDRAEALGLVQRVLAAADEAVRQRWDYLCEPVGLALFGSCLDPARPTVGDVDLMYDVRWLPELRGTPGVLLDHLHALFERDGRRWHRIGDENVWAVEKLLRRLKNRSRHISLHNAARDGELDCRVRVLWRLGEGWLAVPAEQSSVEFAEWCAAMLEGGARA
jgi:hypothetical protein